MAQSDYALKTTNGVEFSRQPPRVLIVDDEPRMLTALSELLRMRNHDVTAASSGRLAIELLRDQHFDLVLLDLNMPGTDGFAVMAHIERHNKQTATIVVSGDTTIDAAIRAMRQGVHDFVRKPYAPEDLLRIIDKSLAQRKRNKAQLDSSEQIEQSEKWHRYLVHQSPDILYTLDSAGR